MTKDKKYYEVVFEGSYKLICGMLEGFMLGSGAEWTWCFSKKCHIEAETMTDLISEWATMKKSIHHVVLEEAFHKKLQKASAERSDLRYIHPKYTKSAREIKSATIKLTAKTFSRKYGQEIKELLSKTPEKIALEDYDPKEIVHKSARGVELYAPDHDYIFKAEAVARGDIKSIIDFRKILDNHPLIEVTDIRLCFE